MTLEEAQSEIEELKTGNAALVKKNSEILDEMKQERKKNRDGEVDSNKFYELQDKYDSLLDTSKKFEHDLKGREKDILKLTESNDGLSSNLQNVLIDGGLADNLAKIGVKAEFLDATKALLRGQVSIIDNKAVVGDKPLGDFMSEWASSEGKAFVPAQENSGGNGQGGGQGGKQTKKRSEMSHSEKGAYIKEHGEAEYFKIAK